jgi:hypothetical protein
LLLLITRQAIRRGSFRSVRKLTTATAAVALVVILARLPAEDRR